VSISRIYQSTSLIPESNIELDDAASHHLARVLRAKVNDKIIVFNGEGGEYSGTIIQISKKAVTVHLHEHIARDVESSLELYLAQGISRGEKMDFTIQKAVELGVKKIIPVLTERCNVKLDQERQEKRLQHWRAICIGACEQSGRNYVPEITMPCTFPKFIAQSDADFKFVLAPVATTKLSQIAIPKQARVVLLIGPEGGLSDKEIEIAVNNGFIALNLGPRILRTETAAVAAITTLQYHAGDLG